VGELTTQRVRRLWPTVVIAAVTLIAGVVIGMGLPGRAQAPVEPSPAPAAGEPTAADWLELFEMRRGVVGMAQRGPKEWVFVCGSGDRLAEAEVFLLRGDPEKAVDFSREPDGPWPFEAQNRARSASSVRRVPLGVWAGGPLQIMDLNGDGEREAIVSICGVSYASDVVIDFSRKPGSELVLHGVGLPKGIARWKDLDGDGLVELIQETHIARMFGSLGSLPPWLAGHSRDEPLFLTYALDGFTPTERVQAVLTEGWHGTVGNPPFEYHLMQVTTEDPLAGH